MSRPRRDPAARPLRALAVSAALAALAACAHGPSPKQRQAAEIHYQLGAEALRGDRRGEAIREFGEAVKLDERHAPARLGLGLTHQMENRMADAEREYRRALALDPNLADAHNALGQLLALTGRVEAALPEFDRALEDPTYRDAYAVRFNKAQALFVLGRRDEAVAELRTCLSLAPRYCRGHRELGRMELARGRTADALGAFRRYAELCASSADAWYQLGLAELKAGSSERARDAFERCGAMADDPVVDECREKAGVLR